VTQGPSLEEFKRFAAAYQPFPWEISGDDAYKPADMRGKHAVLISLVRFWRVIAAIRQSCPEFRSIIDVGPYPGAMLKMLRHFFSQDFSYLGVGLGFSGEYRQAMAALGGECFETELDPDFVVASETREWPIQDADCVLLLDVIEHLTNPIPCLDAINRSLRPGGKLIVTTDNLTSFANTYQMMRRGQSPNIHPLRSSLFYQGEWRPHFREFSRGELAFYLHHAGFKEIRHEYFERQQGDYSIDATGQVSHQQRHVGIRGAIQRACLSIAPHLKDHHLVVVEKTKDFSELRQSRSQPTQSIEEWRKMRSAHGL
jgi:SAM-dependent methyltransferase